jgi:hypothetical protein
MIEIYGGKSEGRYKGFYDFFNEISMELGITQVHSSFLRHLIKYLEQYFKYRFLKETQYL